MNHLVQTFDRSVLTSQPNHQLVNNVIILPDILLSQSLDMCISGNEKAGWLVCKKELVHNADLISYIVEHIWISDEGDVGFVRPTKTLSLPEEYTGIEFHVHPSTLLPEYWHSHFSEGDFQAFANRQEYEQEGPLYKHVLFTPSHILTFGKELPGFIVSGTGELGEEVLERQRYWKSIIG